MKVKIFGYPEIRLFCFDNGTGGAGGGGTGGGSGAGAGSDGAGSGGQTSGTGAGTGQGAGAGSGGSTGGGTQQTQHIATIDWATAPAQFRQAYEQLKTQHDQLNMKFKPFESINPDQFKSFQGSHTQVMRSIQQVSNALGIDESEVNEAISQFGVVAVLDHLRQEAWEAEQADAGNQEVINERDLNERIQNGIQQAISPIQQRENQRLVHEANSLTERTIVDLATAHYKAQGSDYTQFPQPLRDFISTGVTEVLKYDDQGLLDLKFQGKTAPIQKAFQTFMAMFDQAYLARRGMEGGVVNTGNRGAGQGNQNQVGQRQGKMPTIDEIIDDPNRVRTAQGRPVYQT